MATGIIGLIAVFLAAAVYDNGLLGICGVVITAVVFLEHVGAQQDQSEQHHKDGICVLCGKGQLFFDGLPPNPCEDCLTPYERGKCAAERDS